MRDVLARVSSVALILAGTLSNFGWSDDRPIRFDLAPIAVARIDLPEPGETGELNDSAFNPVSLQADGVVPVTFELKLSSMIIAPTTPRIDQWLVRCIPRDRSMLVSDYAPKTETISDYVGPVSVKRIDEKTDAFGISIDGSYGHAARGKVGADHGRNSSVAREFQQHAPVQVVTASGTVDRGRGVYFKLRWTHHQVLEGEKVFRITLAAPSDWRGGLVDVSVVAQAERKTLGGFDRETETLGAAHFTVAVYREGDDEARRIAHALARAEDELRRLASTAVPTRSVHSLSSLMHVVAMKFDADAEPSSTACVDRLIRGTADPHGDRELRKLPMEVRVAALEYCDRRNEFAALRRRPVVSY